MPSGFFLACLAWGRVIRLQGALGALRTVSPSPQALSLSLCAHLIVRLSVATKTPPYLLSPDPSSPGTQPPRSIQSHCRTSAAGPSSAPHPVHLIDKLPLPSPSEPPQVLLDGQWHERRHDASLYSPGQWGWGWRQQGNSLKRSKSIRRRRAPELLNAATARSPWQRQGSAWECSWRALGPVLCAGDFGPQPLLGGMGPYLVTGGLGQTSCTGQWGPCCAGWWWWRHARTEEQLRRAQEAIPGDGRTGARPFLFMSHPFCTF